MDSTIIWSHRGPGFGEIQNILSSFRMCVNMGVDGIKIEPHLSKDGALILRFFLS